jgi:two-component system response regulator YesN
LHHAAVNRDGGVLDAIDRYITEHIHQNISLHEVADLLFYSPSYLSRLFKALSGHNFSEYLSQRKMKHAEELLAGTALKVQEVSAWLGYKDVRYFERLFRDYTGSTPTAFRRRQAFNRGLDRHET